ncbi:MAG: ABC transporter permease [Methylobacteriaceae bacterium]|nr:ABC transporter permease [Methylobacteriaceae bacterium]
MTSTSVQAPAPVAVQKRAPSLYFGGWELGLIVFMMILYAIGVWINPDFFGTTDALSAVFRDASRYGIMAIGMTFVIVNKEIDLSVGSTLGLTTVVFSILFSPTNYDMDVWPAAAAALGVALGIGLINGLLVTVLQVPSFIATLTMLFIGRGLVLGLTGGENMSYDIKTRDFPAFFSLADTNSLGFNNQIIIFLVVAAIGAVVLASTRMGFETYATGGNEQAARYSGVPTRWVRIRSYILSSLTAGIAGLMTVAQSHGLTSQEGLGAELIAIASVIVGGASIVGGRGRIAGSCLGALLVVLIDKVLREQIPVTRTQDFGGTLIEVQGSIQLPAGAVPAFLGLILLVSVLIEPWLVRRRVLQRAWARIRGLPPPLALETGGIAITGAQTRGTVAQARGVEARGFRAFFHRRDAAAIMLMVALWALGLWFRPDFWGSLDNTFAMLLAFTEIGLLAIGLTFVIANGDIDLSVGSVLAFAGAAAAFLMKEMDASPLVAVIGGFAAGAAAGVINGWLTTRLKLPAFVSTLGMFYMARGLAAWLVAGRQLSGFPETFNLIGRNVYDVLDAFGIAPTGGLWLAVAKAVSAQTIFLAVVAVLAAIVLGHMPYGQKCYAIGGNERAAAYSGINTARVRFTAFVFSALCAAAAGVIYVAYYRSFNPSAGQLRELDAIASVIIGGGSIFGGYGTIAGSLAGAAVITLIRSLLSLQIIWSDGTSFVLPQHWMNVFIGLILLFAVVGDIWLRQNNIFAIWVEGWRAAQRRPIGGTA